MHLPKSSKVLCIHMIFRIQIIDVQQYCFLLIRIKYSNNIKKKNKTMITLNKLCNMVEDEICLPHYATLLFWENKYNDPDRGQGYKFLFCYIQTLFLFILTQHPFFIQS